MLERIREGGGGIGTPMQIHCTPNFALFWSAPEFPSILRAAQSHDHEFMNVLNDRSSNAGLVFFSIVVVSAVTRLLGVPCLDSPLRLSAHEDDEISVFARLDAGALVR